MRGGGYGLTATRPSLVFCGGSIGWSPCGVVGDCVSKDFGEGAITDDALHRVEVRHRSLASARQSFVRRLCGFHLCGCGFCRPTSPQFKD